MNEEIFEQLKENFPVLKKLMDSISLGISNNNKLQLMTKDEIVYDLTQQDCLELSQLFALLATAFEEINENE